MGNNSTVFWIIAILLLGAILRLSIYNLAPLFMDTAFYASLGRAIADGDLLLQVNHVSDKPPLFFYLEGIYMILSLEFLQHFSLRFLREVFRFQLWDI